MKIEPVEIPREILRAAIELAHITSPSAGMEAYQATHKGDSVLIMFSPGFSRAVVSTPEGYERFYDVKTVHAVIRKLLGR